MGDTPLANQLREFFFLYFETCALHPNSSWKKINEKQNRGKKNVQISRFWI